LKTLKRKDALVYEANPNYEPLLSVKPKEVFKVEAEDNFEQVLIKKGTGNFTSEDLEAAKFVPLKANPVGGPIFIEGAEDGDLLAISIEDIVPLEHGWTGEMMGILQDKVGWEECHGYWAYVTDHKPGPSGTTSDGKCYIDIDGQKFEWDVAPFIGTIFTQPQKGRGMPDTLTVQGPYGGNVDVRDVCKGSTIYINSFNKGGLLYLGDCHASQGDSELNYFRCKKHLL
jgi:amidase